MLRCIIPNKEVLIYDAVEPNEVYKYLNVEDALEKTALRLNADYNIGRYVALGITSDENYNQDSFYVISNNGYDKLY